jgi:diketogulonate reductase-like aldo/keto reductase
VNLFDFELSPEDMEKLDSLDKGKEGCITWNPVDAP